MCERGGAQGRSISFLDEMYRSTIMSEKFVDLEILSVEGEGDRKSWCRDNRAKTTFAMCTLKAKTVATIMRRN